MYGKSVDRSNMEGAKEVVTNWQTHTSNVQDESKNPRNFKTLNKKAVIDGKVTAPQNRMYR